MFHLIRISILFHHSVNEFLHGRQLSLLDQIELVHKENKVFEGCVEMGLQRMNTG